MSPQSSPPQENFTATHDAAELRNLLETEFVTIYTSASLSDLNLCAGAVIEVGGQSLQCTKAFLKDLAAFIGMPLRYANDIDFGLFRHNFEERKWVTDRRVQVCIVGGCAAGLARGDYRPALTLDVLNALPLADEKFWKLQKACLSARNVEIDFVSEDFCVEAKKGDVIRAGIRISNSETGGCGLKASMFTLRLVCLNGAVMSDGVGSVRWSYDNRMAYMSSINQFVHNLLRLRDRQDDLRRIYAAAVERPVFEEEVSRLWRRVRSAGHFTPEEADAVLGLTAEERRRLTSAVAGRQAAHEPAAESVWDLFTIHNRVTAAAKLYPFGLRSRLERIGGSVLSAAAQN